MQASFILEVGPLLRAGWFEIGEEERRLVLIIHHLVVDGVSWRILLEDLQTLCGQFRNGEALRLPQQTSSFGQWSEALGQYARSGKARSELPHWRSLAACHARGVPKDHQLGENTVGTLATVQVVLSQPETQTLLQGAPRACRVGIEDVLITAVVEALEQWNGCSGVLLELEGHGREELSTTIDVSRTVGWFTTMYPVYFELHEKGLRQKLETVKTQLRAVPTRGLGYGVLRYLDPEGRQQLNEAPRPEVVFNYLGQLDQVLTATGWLAAEDLAGLHRSTEQRRAYLLEINACVINGSLYVTWGYSRAAHRRDTITDLADDCVRKLRELIRECVTTDSVTPSDFPLVQLTNDELRRIIEEQNDDKEGGRL